MKMVLKNYKSLVLFQWLFLLLPFILMAQNENTETGWPDTLIFKEKLDSIIQKASEKNSFKETNGATEENFPQYFLNKKVIDSLQLRRLPDSIIKQLKQDDNFWYANYNFKKTDPTRVPILERQWFQVLLWLIIIGGFAAFIMWYLAFSQVGIFRKSDKPIDTIADEGLIMDDIFAINYQKEIENAIQNKNYRLAIRLMFLRQLKDLSKKNIIQYKQDKTNLDYLMELASTSYYTDFFRLTRNYEYSWYGQFGLNTDTFIQIRNEFENFKNKLAHS